MNTLLLVLSFLTGEAERAYIPQQFCAYDRKLICCADRPLTLFRVDGPHGVAAHTRACRPVAGGEECVTPRFCRYDFETYDTGLPTNVWYPFSIRRK